MVHSGLALNTGGATGNIDHMLAVGNGHAAMTMKASGVLGTVKQVLESGQYSDGEDRHRAAAVDCTVAVACRWATGRCGSAKAASPANARRRLAVHQVSRVAEQQASLAVEGGYAPIRSDATKVPVLAQRWRTEPIYRVSYDQLTTGAENAATAGSLIGDYQGVRDAVKDGMLVDAHRRAVTRGGAAEGAARSRHRDQGLQRPPRRRLTTHCVDLPDHDAFGYLSSPASRFGRGGCSLARAVEGIPPPGRVVTGCG